MITVGAVGEEGLIGRIARRFPDPVGSSPLVRGIGDDAALLRAPAGLLQAVTSDLLLEGTHFRRDWIPPDVLGRKALAVNLSDLAAMGAEPTAFLLDLGLPSELPLSDFENLLDGLACAAGEAGGLPLAGGDTCVAGRLHLGLTLLGTVAAERVIGRSGARPGDVLAVSGTLGDASLGLRLLESGWRWQAHSSAAREPDEGAAGISTGHALTLLSAHLLPAAQLELGQSLAGRVTSGMDLSDGLAADLPRLCRASGCSATVDLETLPVSQAAVSVCSILGLDASRQALSGGEDYQLLLTVPASVWREGSDSWPGLTAIGEITGPETPLMLRSRGRRELWPRPSFEHFPGT